MSGRSVAKTIIGRKENLCVTLGKIAKPIVSANKTCVRISI